MSKQFIYCHAIPVRAGNITPTCACAFYHLTLTNWLPTYLLTIYDKVQQTCPVKVKYTRHYHVFSFWCFGFYALLQSFNSVSSSPSALKGLKIRRLEFDTPSWSSENTRQSYSRVLWNPFQQFGLVVVAKIEQTTFPSL